MATGTIIITWVCGFAVGFLFKGFLHERKINQRARVLAKIIAEQESSVLAPYDQPAE